MKIFIDLPALSSMDWKSYSARLRPLAIALLLAFGAPLARANPLEQGKTQFMQDNYEEAYALFLSAIQAAPNSVDAHYHAGAAALAIPELIKAKQHFGEALKRHPGHSEALAGLAETYYALGELGQAKSLINQSAKQGPALSERLRFLRAMILTDEGDTDKALADFRLLRQSATYSQRAGYRAGLIEASQGNTETARKSWEDALALEPNSATADAIRYSATILKTPAKGVIASIAYHFEHDSNVVIGPSTSVPGLVSAQSDTRHVFNFNLHGQSALGPNTSLSGDYYFYQNSHRDLDKFDQQAHEARIALSFPVGRMNLRLPYTFSLYNVDSDRYLVSHTITPTLEIPLPGQAQIFRPFVKFQSNDYRTALLPDENRDSKIIAGGFGYTVSLVGKSTVGLLYEYGQEDADGANWDNKYHRLEGRVKSPLGEKLNFRGVVEYVRNDFDNLNNSFLLKRKDNSYTLTLGFSYPILKQAVLSFDAAFNKHNSTIPAYDYDRDVYSLGLSWYFQ